MSFSLRSFGLKRYIASALTALAGILAGDPSTVFLLPIVGKLAALVGLTGLVHAGKDGNILENSSLSLGALFPLLILATDYVPQLAAYKTLLLSVGALFGLSTVATTPLPREAAQLKIAKKK